MEDKINTFAGLPNAELSKLSEDKNDEKEFDKLRSVEKEFAQTNLHTKQTGETTSNTDNTDNTGDTGADTPAPSKTDKKNRLGKLMGGTFAVDLVDMLIPSLVVLIVNRVGYLLEKKDLQLSKSEKEALSPAVQDVLDEIEIDFNNPFVNLGVMLAIVYGSKIIDKIPAMKKKADIKPENNKRMSEVAAEIVNGSGEGGEALTDFAKFEIDYGALVDKVRLERKRGIGDAKQYIAVNYSEKIKAIAVKHKIPYSQIREQLDFEWTPKKREPKPQAGSDFDLQ